MRVPTLILQCRDDVIAPPSVGEYVHAQIPDSTLVVLDATGHCPNLSAPEETVDRHQGLPRLSPDDADVADNGEPEPRRAARRR